MTRHDDHTAQQDVTTLATQGIVRFLQEHEQLSQMEVAHQQFLAEQCTRRTFVAGESLLSPESGQVKQWYLLFDGKVEGTQQVASAAQPEVRFYLTPVTAFLWLRYLMSAQHEPITLLQLNANVWLWT